MTIDLQERNKEILSQPVEIAHGSLSFIGELSIPTDAKGVVIFGHVHGDDYHNTQNQYLARALRATGIGTLLIDLLTRQERDEKLIQSFQFNIGPLATRLVETAGWFATRPEGRDLGIGYLGTNSAAAAALVAAARLGSAIDAVVLHGGRSDLAWKVLHKVRAPTFLIVAEFDEALFRPNEKAYTQLQCEKELRVVPGATHLLEEEDALEELAGLAAGWFRRHLGHPSKVDTNHSHVNEHES